MYCCSNSSSSRASFTLPNNRIISYNYRNIRYRQYTGGDTYAGCARFYYDYYYYSHLNFPGIYTCNIGDSRGNNIAVNIGLYSEGFNSKFIVPLSMVAYNNMSYCVKAGGRGLMAITSVS